MSIKEKTIEQLVSANPSIAAALHFLGIHFLNYSELTLTEVCTQKGWKIENLQNRINDAINSPDVKTDTFEALPIDLLVEYLKHNHYIFIKKRLPFIAELVKNFDGDKPEIKKELQIVFPLFVEEFINHIYEEEDTLFTYINLLNKATKDEVALNKAQAKMMDNSIKQHQVQHEIHDDHLKGLRELTNNFTILDDFDLKTKVVLSELKKLDEELYFHAKVENNILFPRALEIETKLLAHVRSNIAMN
ncbi:MAG: hemerythrin domain-containing protein [Bacteroidota bacterium]|nr:hemerythrin domain-containing protein [Bacteroidota bacterium]